MTYLVVPRVERVLDDAADELLRQNRELRLESRRERREVALFVSLEAAGVLDFVDVVSKGRCHVRSTGIYHEHSGRRQRLKAVVRVLAHDGIRLSKKVELSWTAPPR